MASPITSYDGAVAVITGGASGSAARWPACCSTGVRRS